MSLKAIKIYQLKWIHISPITDGDISHLEQHYRFHPLDINDCREGVQRPKLDVYRNYLFMIFHFPNFDKQTRRVGVQSLNVFLGKDFIITMTKEPDETLEKLFGRMKRTSRFGPRYDALKNSSAYTLYKILDMLYRRNLPMINDIGKYLSDVEEDVYSNRNKEATAQLAVIRRNIMNLRRQLEPQVKMVDRLVNLKRSLIPEKLSVYLDDVHDYMENMWSALEGYRDTLDGLYNTNESFINQKTNEVIKTLTVISVALLPMTLVASIYGMNVTGLPFANHPIGVWVVFFILAGIVLGSIYFARRKNII